MQPEICTGPECNNPITTEWITIVRSRRPAAKKDDPVLTCSTACTSALRIRSWWIEQKKKKLEAKQES